MQRIIILAMSLHGCRVIAKYLGGRGGGGMEYIGVIIKA